MVNLTFEQAISKSQDLLDRLEHADLPEDLVSKSIAGIDEMLCAIPSARGFFVSLLTADRSASDDPPAWLMDVLRRHPETVLDLIAKNLVMASAQLTDAGASDQAQLEGSKKVTRRSTMLAVSIALPGMKERLDQMLAAIGECLSAQPDQGDSVYGKFLLRWRYSHEQLKSCQAAIFDALGEISRKCV